MKTLLAALLFQGLAFALYANSLEGDYVFDDSATFQRRAIREESLGELLTEYRPLRYLSLRLDEAAYRVAVGGRKLTAGEERRSHHIFNVIFHGITAFLVFLILRRLAGFRVAIAGALLFVAHPAHTECVAYMSGRRDVLSTLFYLLAFLCWLEFKRLETPRRWLWLAGVPLLGAVAMTAKETAVTLPAVCVLHDLLFSPETARRRIPIYAAAAGVAGIAVYWVLAYSGATHIPTWHGASVGANVAITARLLTHYAWLVVFPFRLLGDYSINAWPLSESLFDPRALLALAVIGAVAFAAFRYRHRAPPVTFGIGWFVVALAPVLQIVPFHEIAADRHLYLASVGVCLLGGLGFAWVHARAGESTAQLALTAILIAFGVRTVIRNRDYADAETFWRATIATAPECARAHFNLGTLFAKRAQDQPDPAARTEDYSRAAEHMQRAVDINPGYIVARVRLGQVYAGLSRQDKARENWEEALRLARPMPYPPFDPGMIAMFLGRLELAVEVYEERLRIGTRSMTALNGLVTCERHLADRAKKTGHPEEAAEHMRRALDAGERLLLERPNDIRLLRVVANVARDAGEPARARELTERANALARQRR